MSVAYRGSLARRSTQLREGQYCPPVPAAQSAAFANNWLLTLYLNSTVFQQEFAAEAWRIAVTLNSKAQQKAVLLNPWWASSSQYSLEISCMSIYLSKNHSVLQSGIKNISKELRERINTVY